VEVAGDDPLRRAMDPGATPSKPVLPTADAAEARLAAVDAECQHRLTQARQEAREDRERMLTGARREAEVIR
jgi:hypothetical protein